MIAGVADDDLDVRAVHQQAVRLAALGLVVDAHALVLREAGEEGVLAHEVPVAHPGRAEVPDGAVVGEGSGGGKLLGHAFGEGIRLRDGEQGRSGLHGFEDSVLEMAGSVEGRVGGLAGLQLTAGDDRHGSGLRRG